METLPPPRGPVISLERWVFWTGVSLLFSVASGMLYIWFVVSVSDPQDSRALALWIVGYVRIVITVMTLMVSTPLGRRGLGVDVGSIWVLWPLQHWLVVSLAMLSLLIGDVVCLTLAIVVNAPVTPVIVIGEALVLNVLASASLLQAFHESMGSIFRRGQTYSPLAQISQAE